MRFEWNKTWFPNIDKYYPKIMKEVCEIKNVIAREENFWEREFYYIIRSDGVCTFFNEIKGFLFQL